MVAITSGANMNFERLRLVSELADLGAATEVMMVTSIPERAGAFQEFVTAATSAGRDSSSSSSASGNGASSSSSGSSAGVGSDFNVTEFKYR